MEQCNSQCEIQKMTLIPIWCDTSCIWPQCSLWLETWILPEIWDLWVSNNNHWGWETNESDVQGQLKMDRAELNPNQHFLPRDRQKFFEHLFFLSYYPVNISMNLPVPKWGRDGLILEAPLELWSKDCISLHSRLWRSFGIKLPMIYQGEGGEHRKKKKLGQNLCIAWIEIDKRYIVTKKYDVRAATAKRWGLEKVLTFLNFSHSTTLLK